MWQAWDLALDHIVRQLPDLLESKATYEVSQTLRHWLAIHIQFLELVLNQLTFDPYLYSRVSSLLSN